MGQKIPESPGFPSRECWLVRHGETVGLSSIRLYGSTDVPLSDAGRAMVLRAARALQGRSIRRVFASRLSRSLESARIVGGALEAPVEAVAEFDEIDFGEFEGLTVEEARRARPDVAASWSRADDRFRYPGGESIEEFRDRVGCGLDRILARHPEGALAFVLHKGVIKAILAAFLDTPFHPITGRFEVDLGSISRIRLGPHGARVVSWNVLPR